MAEFPTDVQLRPYQRTLLLACNEHCLICGKRILIIGCDVQLAEAYGMLTLGASVVYALNPAFPLELTSPNQQIITLKSLGQQTHLPYASVDIIFGMGLLEHVADLRGLLAECKRVLKAPGYLFLQGNPLWASPKGHHCRGIGVSGATYNYNNHSPWDPWEHLLMHTTEDASKRLFAKGIPVEDIPALIHQLLIDDFISRRSFSQIKSEFYTYLTKECEINAGMVSSQISKHKNFAEARKLFSDEDLLTQDIQCSWFKVD